MKLKGEIVNRYASQAQAAKAVGVRQVSIFNCCRGGQREAGGLGWKYADRDGRETSNPVRMCMCVYLLHHVNLYVCVNSTHMCVHRCIY